MLAAVADLAFVSNVTKRLDNSPGPREARSDIGRVGPKAMAGLVLPYGSKPSLLQTSEF